MIRTDRPAARRLAPAPLAAPVLGARGRRLALRGLALGGVAVSAYLTWVHYSGGLALCTGAGGCEVVQASRYAVVAGLPVALLGLLLYLGLLGLSLWPDPASAGGAGNLALATFGLALAGTLYSAYLTWLELFVILAICPWCVTSALIMLGILAIASWELLAGDG